MAGAAANAEAVELAYWNSIAGSGNTADFDSYLAQYPQGKFADLARNKLKATKTMAPLARAETRGDMQAPGPVAMARPGKVFSSAGSFSFEDKSDAPMRAAELISISCRDAIRGKRVRLVIEEKGAIAQQSRSAFHQAIAERMKAIGVKVAASGATDFVVKGVIEAGTGANPVLGVGEVDLDADFSLALASGKRLAQASASGGAYGGHHTASAVKGAAQGVWEEKSDEIVGKLFRDYCADR